MDTTTWKSKIHFSLSFSDSSSTRSLRSRFYFSTTQIRKRPSTGTKPKQKRLRVQASQILHQNQPKLSTSKPQPVQSVFEQAVGKPQQPSKIGVKLADTITAIFEAGPQRILAQDEEKTGRKTKQDSNLRLWCNALTTESSCQKLTTSIIYTRRN